MPGLLENLTPNVLAELLRRSTGFADVTPDARRGELGWLRQPYGLSTELSTTLQDPRLMGGKPVNIPLMVQGQVGLGSLFGGAEPTDQQYEIAIRRALDRVKGGAYLPTFESLQQADKAAQTRPVGEKMQPYITAAQMFSDMLRR